MRRDFCELVRFGDLSQFHLLIVLGETLSCLNVFHLRQHVFSLSGAPMDWPNFVYATKLTSDKYGIWLACCVFVHEGCILFTKPGPMLKIERQSLQTPYQIS